MNTEQLEIIKYLIGSIGSVVLVIGGLYAFIERRKDKNADERHKDLKELLNRHDDRIMDHGQRISKLEAKNEQAA